MSIHHIHDNCKAVAVLAPIAIGANGTKSGTIIDRAGYGGVEFLTAFGAVTTTGSVATLVVKEGDTTGAMTSVADADLLGTELLASLPAAAARTDGSTKNVGKRIGYAGNKRYVTANIVSTGTTSVGCVSVTALLHNPSNAPVANP